MLTPAPCRDDDRPFLDRLVALQQLISPEPIRQALADTPDSGRGVLSPTVMLWVLLALGLHAELPIREVYRLSQTTLHLPRIPGRAALCRARQRLGPVPMRRLFDAVVRPQATPSTPGAFYHGYRLVGFDSTRLTLPDTPELERVFGRPQSQHGGGGYPQLHKLSLVELGTHVELALQIKPCRRNERVMVPALLKHLPEDSLLLMDAGFYSLDLWRTLRRQGVQVLARVNTNRLLGCRGPFERRLVSDHALSQRVRSNQATRWHRGASAPLHAR